MTEDLIDPTPELPDDTPIDKVQLPTRVRNALADEGLKTLGEVREKSDEELLRLQNLGENSVNYLRTTLGMPSHAGVRPPKR